MHITPNPSRTRPEGSGTAVTCTPSRNMPVALDGASLDTNDNVVLAPMASNTTDPDNVQL